MAEQNVEEVVARFEELAVLESDFDAAEDEIIRTSNALKTPLYKKRAAIVAKIPHFWALVFEQSPPEVDNYIQPSDSKVFGDCLESLEVTRFEIDDPKGSPRSFSIKFGFSENEYFEDKSLEKKFWHRQTNDTNSWEGLVSEPVKINWKKGKDLTDGLTDAAYALYQAKQKVSVAANGKDQAKWTKLPEYKALADKIQNSEEASNSFFTWFGFVSDYRWVSAEESEQASKAYAAKLAKAKAGEKLEEEPEEEDDSYDYQETEVFPLGGELATIVVEDMWPSAIKYYKRAHETDFDDEDLSDLDVEDMDDESDEEIDIRALVGKGRKDKKSNDSPPAKKQRKA